MQVEEDAKPATQEILPLAQLRGLLDDCKRSLDKNLEKFEPLQKVNELIVILNA